MLTLLGLATCLVPAGASETAVATRPNFLFIIADDQSPFDFKAYEPRSPLETPVIDRLSARGMTIDGAYHMGSWSGAVCTPSRHMVMSGRTVWHLPSQGIRNSGPNPLCPEDLPEQTMAAVFNRAGYDTMRTCKKGNSYEEANGKFTVLHEAVKRGMTAEDGSAWHADRVLEYLEQRESEQDEDPFLIYFGFSHPHDPRWAEEELAAKYGAHNTEIPDPPHPAAPALPDNYLPQHPFHHGHPGLRDEVNVQGVGKRRDAATIRNEIGRQLACSENIDTQIGRVLDKLEQMGVLENTYVIYTADHGMAIGRHGLQGKQNLYEHTWRVPLIVMGPGIKPGTRSQGNVYLLDCLGTLCDLAGIEIPETFEGVSFRPVLEGRQARVRDLLYGVYSGGTKPGIRAVRMGDWKLIKYDVLDGYVRETQLFDLSQNPWEILPQHHAPEVIALTGYKPQGYETNLASDPRYATRLTEMEALLLSEMERLDDPYRLWNQPPK